MHKGEKWKTRERERARQIDPQGQTHKTHRQKDIHRLTGERTCIYINILITYIKRANSLLDIHDSKWKV